MNTLKEKSSRKTEWKEEFCLENPTLLIYKVSVGCWAGLSFDSIGFILLL